VITFPFLFVRIPAALVHSAEEEYYSSIIFPWKNACIRYYVHLAILSFNEDCYWISAKFSVFNLYLTNIWKLLPESEIFQKTLKDILGSKHVECLSVQNILSPKRLIALRIVLQQSVFSWLWLFPCILFRSVD